MKAIALGIAMLLNPVVAAPSAIFQILSKRACWSKAALLPEFLGHTIRHGVLVGRNFPIHAGKKSASGQGNSRLPWGKRRLLPMLLLFAGLAWAAPYDLVVYGATPQGVMAAVAAARAGLRVVVLEPTARVGGVFTNGGLATLDLGLRGRGHPYQEGLFTEFYRRIGGHPSFDLKRAEGVLRQMLLESGAELRLDSRLVSLEVRGKRVERVTFEQGSQLLALEAPYFIDASDTAELAYRAGAGFTTGREDTGLDKAQMAAGLSFELEGVPWFGVLFALSYEKRALRTGGGVSENSGWGFGQLAFSYQPSDAGRFRLRGLNLARQRDGSVWVNALLVYNVDATNPESQERSRRAASAEVRRVVEYLRRSSPALFGAARLAETAPELYIRESRHLKGLYRLKADDVLYGRDFPDTIAVGSYPLDGQAYRPDESPYLLGSPAPYGVPLRSLIPQGFGNLLVVSQAASFDSVAAFSARVAPLQMALGQAAGVAAYIAREQSLDFPALAASPELLRERLLSEGANLLPKPSSRAKDQASPGYPAALELYRRGLFSTPYFMEGGLYLEEPILARDFLANLEHFYLAKSPTGPQVRAVSAAESFYRSSRQRALYEVNAYELLSGLGMRLSLPEHNDKIRRGEAAALLWELFKPALTKPLKEPAKATKMALGSRP